MTESALKNLQIFGKLCGQISMPNIILVTTMWSKVDQETAERRETDLKREYWKDMIRDGCRTERFKDSYESAWRIVGKLLGKESVLVSLPREIVDGNLRLNETQAGIVLNKELKKLIRGKQEAARRLREQMGKQTNDFVVQELNQQQKEIDTKIRQIADQLREMKIPFTRKIRLFFRKNNAWAGTSIV
jgi:chromosome condensin MukBEF ATPase and DNA-binding subunit MukB